LAQAVFARVILASNWFTCISGQVFVVAMAGELASTAAADKDASEALEGFIVNCRVVAVTALRKKGHQLVELSTAEDQSMQVVTDQADIAVGNIAVVALAGATLAGRLVNRQKVAGEWSEGAIVSLQEEHIAATRATENETLQVTTQEEVNLDEDGDESDIDGEALAWQVLPRADGDDVASLLHASPGCLHHVRGDATKVQHGKGNKIIAHVVNDKGRWGKGFVMAITDEWGKVPGQLYRKWHKAGAKADFRLGRVQLLQLPGTLCLANIVGQSGIKTGSQGPPVRYEAISEGLDAVSCHAAKTGASIHMPRIGSGLAGGDWAKVQAIVQSMVEKYGVDVYVYEYA